MKCVTQSPVQYAFKKCNQTKILKLSEKSKYHTQIIQELADMENETSGFFVKVIMKIIKTGPLTDSLLNNMNAIFSGRWIDDDVKTQYHKQLVESGTILAEFGNIKGLYLAIQLANVIGRSVYPSETKEKLIHACLEAPSKCEEDRWISRIVQSYFIVDL